jgi:hypothetical protein
MHQAIQNRVGERLVADSGVPLVRGQLTDDHHHRVKAIAIIHNFHQTIALRGTQGLQAPVIQDQQPSLGQLLEALMIGAINLGLG